MGGAPSGRLVTELIRMWIIEWKRVKQGKYDVDVDDVE